jgi:glycogen debranching enzyme
LGSGSEVRPNQVFAGCLPFPILELSQTRLMLERVRSELVTPRGLRTLAPGDRDYRPRYSGGPYERDSAYHQGTVWPWLLGPYAEALILCSDFDEVDRISESFKLMLHEGCIGSIAEVYDAEEPQFAAGCFAQAWSVAAACRVFER